MIDLLVAAPLLVMLGGASVWGWQLRRELEDARAELAENDYAKLMATARELHRENQELARETAKLKAELQSKDDEAIRLQREIEGYLHEISKRHAIACRFEKRVEKQQAELDRLRSAVIDLETQAIAEGR